MMRAAETPSRRAGTHIRTDAQLQSRRALACRLCVVSRVCVASGLCGAAGSGCPFCGGTLSCHVRGSGRTPAFGSPTQLYNVNGVPDQHLGHLSQRRDELTPNLPNWASFTHIHAPSKTGISLQRRPRPVGMPAGSEQCALGLDPALPATLTLPRDELSLPHVRRLPAALRRTRVSQARRLRTRPAESASWTTRRTCSRSRS